MEKSVFNAKCGAQQVLDRIADKWTALVIYALARGAKRTSELKRQIGGVSQKMLTQTLRSLERDGLVQRKVYPVAPPKVEYSLTSLGKTLFEPLRAICKWAEEHLHELQAARARHRGGDGSLRALSLPSLGPRRAGSPPPLRIQSP